MSALGVLLGRASPSPALLDGRRRRGGEGAAAVCCRRRRGVAAAATPAAAPPPRPLLLPLGRPRNPKTTPSATGQAQGPPPPPAKNSQAAADQFFSADDREAAYAFARLLEQAGGEGAAVALRPSGGGGGRGLFLAAASASAGDVLLRVPFSACLSVVYAPGGEGRVSTPRIPGDDDADDNNNDQRPTIRWPRLASGVRRAAAAAEAAAEEAALPVADDEDDGGRPMSASSGAADELEALTWDVLLALGVMDALAGDGGDWWARYSAALFPAPEAVALPMCWSPPLLDALRHASVAEAARAQQLRLRMLYAPFCAAPAAEGAPNGGAPSYMQWAFACVRSRACRLTERDGEERGSGGNGNRNGNGGSSSSSSRAATFALVPFLDCVNHSDRPNAAYRLVFEDEGAGTAEQEEDRRNNGGETGGGGGGGASSSAFVELVAMSDVRSGDEVCISYTGPPPAAATNRLLMAQYGFVPSGGNPRDRYEELAFGAFSLRDPKRRGTAEGAGAASGGQPQQQQAAASGFRLRAVQGAVGDGFFLAALKGEDPYAFAALKSLPLARDEQDAAREASERGLPLRPEFSGGGSDGDAPCPPDAAEVALAERLLTTLRMGPLAELKGGCASVREALEQDEALLGRLEAAGAGAGAGAGGLSRDEADPRFAAAVRYRVERARLMLAVERVLLALAQGASSG